MKQEHFNIKANKFFSNIKYILFFLFVVWVIYASVTDIFGWLGDKMDDRDSRKQECIDRTFHVKNEFTAKKMYKKCMSE